MKSLIQYEIPYEAVREAIVNAVTHRDYTSNASVQVMLFADRLEIWNPGQLPASLTFEKLRKPHASIPHNPLIAEPMFLATYAEKAGSGILDMLSRCRKAGLRGVEFREDGGQFVQTLWRPKAANGEQDRAGAALGRDQVTPEVAPEVTPEVAPEVQRLLQTLRQPMDRQSLQRNLSLKAEKNFRLVYLRPALEKGLIAMTIPDKPRSSRQKYRLTDKGRAWMANVRP